MATVPLISIIEDDDRVRMATGGLVVTLGYNVETFESGEAFLDSQSLEKTQCLIADIQLPGMSGPQLQQHLGKVGAKIPILFITAFPAGRVHDQVMQRGAVAYLTKPFDRATLKDRLQWALRPERDSSQIKRDL